MENNVIAEEKELLPFLKWAGGKRWLVSSHPDIFPKSYDCYIEPFLGSGAAFFRLDPKRALLSDTNKELIETYEAIKENNGLVLRYLAEHQRKHSKNYYYRIRSASPKSRFTRAARFIYLNRTCWNALYRVNLSGQFNVPKGSKDAVLLRTDNFRATSKKLYGAKLYCSDFEYVITQASMGDFIFADPPYTVKHNLNGFIKYNERIFSWDDQVRLHRALTDASNRGAKILLTNANHESIRDLYRDGFYISSAKRHSVIAASSENRAKTSELIITNYSY